MGSAAALKNQNKTWDHTDLAFIRRMHPHLSDKELADSLGRTTIAVRVKKKELGLKKNRSRKVRRFSAHNAPDPETVKPLKAGDKALINKTTRYPHSIRKADGKVAVLKSGEHNTKIGRWVEKGALAGMPIYTITLTERATCPSTCLQYRSCYGNSMNWAHRFEHGPEFERQLDQELRAKSIEHPAGFLVRAHILGDFYSTEYVMKWADWLCELAPLHVFGFTHWHPDTDIGGAILSIRDVMWSRFAVRFSNLMGERNALVLPAVPIRPRVGNGIVCPEQWAAIKGDKGSRSCGTCALCWSTDKPIVFVEH